MTEVRAVGFDLDGTLFDHRGSATRGVDNFLAVLGVAPTEAARALWFAEEEAGYARWSAGEISFHEQRRDRLRAVLPSLGVPVDQTPAALDELFEVYLAAYRAAWRPFAGVPPVLEALRAQGLRLGILTNGSQDQQVDKLRCIGLIDAVDVVCTAEELGLWKPDPRAFEEFTRRLGVLPSECLFVGDHPEQDVAGAIAAGMQAVLIDHDSDDAAGLIGALAPYLRQM
jgi:putative hydrolase of the HAD superfamily